MVLTEDERKRRRKETKHKCYLKFYSNVENRKRRIEEVNKWRKENKEIVNEYMTKYQKKNQKILNIKRKEWRNKNIDEFRRKRRNYNYILLLNPTFKIRKHLSHKINMALKSQNTCKTNKTIEYIGCTIEELKQYLQNQFKEGMNWDNYGKWHVDHIKPCKLFNLNNLEEQKKCFHYTNLQPLWGIDNVAKGCKYITEDV